MPHWVKSSPTHTAPLASSRDNFKGSLRFPSQVQGKNGKVSSKWKWTVGAFPCPHSPVFPGKERQKWASSQPEICFHQSLESIKFGNLGTQQTASFNRTRTWEHNLLLQNRAKKGWKKAAGIVSLFLQGQFILLAIARWITCSTWEAAALGHLCVWQQHPREPRLARLTASTVREPAPGTFLAKQK